LQLIRDAVAILEPEIFPHPGIGPYVTKLFILRYLTNIFPHFRRESLERHVDQSGKSRKIGFSAGRSGFPQVFHNSIVDREAADFIGL
jgi:hypothetical protein